MHYRNDDGSFISGHILDAAHEATAAENGWTLSRPPIPEPEAERAALTLEERVTALEEQFAALTASIARRKK
jgi:hypothetical protein